MFDFNAQDTLEILKPFAQWLHDHQLMAGLLTCLIALAESLAIIGYVIPGSIIMPAIGVLIGAGILPAVDIILWAVLGAILGDGFSFWLGRHYHESLRVMWPMSKYPSLLQNSELFFAKHGGKSVFIGRFMGAVRPMVPVVAGMMNMSPLRFYSANILSGLIWAPAFLLPGIILGAATQELPAKVATKFLFVLFGILILLWCMMWLIKWGIHRVQYYMILFLNTTWVFLHRHPSIRPLCKLIRDPTQPYKHGQFTLAIVCALAASLFIWLLTLPLSHPELMPLNQAVDYLFKGLRTASMDTYVAWFSLLASKDVIVYPVFATAAWLWWKKEPIPALHLVGIYLFAFFIIGFFKLSIGGSRPADIGLQHLGNQHSFGFPSGHSTLVIAVYGFFILLITRSWAKSWKKQTIYAALVTLITLSILARLYLGAHWFTDVLGGLFLGNWIISLAALSYRRYPIHNFSRTGVTTVACVSLLSAVVVTGLTSTNLTERYHFTPPSHEMTAQQWWTQDNNAAPFYLRNRLGRVDAVVKIQWLGQLQEIEKTLADLGWKHRNPVTWLDLVERLSPRIDEAPLPLIAKQYQYQNPILEMIKQSNNNNPTQIIYVWPSNITIKDKQQQLYFAHVEYFVPTHQIILQRHNGWTNRVPDGYVELKQRLPNPSLRELRYAQLPDKLHNRGIDNQVLLINENRKV